MGARGSKALPKTPPKVNPQPVVGPSVEQTSGDGLRSLASSPAFRALNFELYVQKNNKIMAFGVITMSLITGYFGYLKATTKNTQLDAEYDKLYGPGAANYMRTRNVNSWN